MASEGKMGQAMMGRRVLKLAVIGDKQVGKTSLIRRYVHDSFSPHYTYTRGGDIKTMEVTINDVTVKVTLVDTAGHKYVRPLIKTLYRDVHAVMVVFDLTRVATFDSLQEWLKQIELVNNSNPVIFLVGNKQDLLPYRSVHYKQAEMQSQLHSIPYYETSAKTGENVQETFVDLLRATWQRVFPRYVPMENIVLSMSEEDPKDNNSCCSNML